MSGKRTYLAGRILDLLRAHGGECMTLAEIVAATGLPELRIKSAIRTLSDHRLVTSARLTCYRLTKLGRGPETPYLKSGSAGHRPRHGARPSPLRDGVWAALRIKRKATIPDLLEVADVEGDRDRQHHIVRQYLSWLARAGVVNPLPRLAKREGPGTGLRVYLLVRDLGPQSPYFDRDKRVVVDRNGGAELPVDEPAEAARERA